jgi:FkbM family methyltransferase
MSLEKIKNYFIPESILDIGANVGQFYNEIKKIFPNSYYYLIEGNDSCKVVLETLNVDYSISLLSDTEKEVDFYVRKHEPRCTGNSIYRENTSFYDDDQIIILKKQTKTLSNILNNKVFDLIKIDVQGSEIDIINGGLDIFKNAKGVLMEISLVEYNQNAPVKEFVYEYMSNMGFIPIETIGNINHPITHELIQQDILFLNQKHDHNNIFNSDNELINEFYKQISIN